MEMAARSTPTADVQPIRTHSRTEGPPEGERPALHTVVPIRDDVRDLSTRLADLERDLRHVWAALVDRDAGLAGRVGHAGRLIHRAASVLEADMIY
jgi:hypothetical protein